MKETIIILVSFFVFSCASDPVKPACETNNTGTLKVLNVNSSNPYAIYVDGDYKGIANGGSSLTVEIKAGTYPIRAIQQSGYIVFPSVYNSSVTVPRCGTENVQF
jgi:hypothetical protein